MNEVEVLTWTWKDGWAMKSLLRPNLSLLRRGPKPEKVGGEV